MFFKYASLLAIVAIAGGEASAAGYDVTVLQDVGGLGNSVTTGINASGQTVGYSFKAGGSDAVLWSPTGAGTALQDVGGQGSSQANGINASGQIVGSSYTGNGYDAVLWSSTGAGTALQDVGGAGYSDAYAINAAGQIVGSSGASKLVLWSSTGAGKALQDGFGLGWPTAINDSGQIVGYFSGSFGSGALFWSPTGVVTLLQDVSLATAINDAGQIVGFSGPLYAAEAILLSPTGAVTVLQDVGGIGSSIPYGINASGQIVGLSGSNAVLWSSTGVGTSLAGVLGSDWSYTRATGINDQGDIVGYGSYLGLGETGFLLTPAAPEPSTWALLLVGFAGLGFVGYRQKSYRLAAVMNG